MHADIKFKKVSATNLTNTSFASLIPTVTAPVVGSGVFDVPEDMQLAGAYAFFNLFGDGSENQTYNFRLISWRKVYNGTLWVPSLLVAGGATLSAMVGVAGSDLVATDRLVDTIALTTLTGTTELISPTGDLAAWFAVPTFGAEKLQFSIDLTGATGANALVGFFRRNPSPIWS